MADRIGREIPNSVYKFPKKTRGGKILYYKSLDAFGTGPSQEYLKSIDPFPEGSDAQKAFIKDLEKQFKDPLNSTAAKEAGVLSKKELAKKHGITFKQVGVQIEKYKNKLGLKYPEQPYKGKVYKKLKQRERRGFIAETSKPVTEKKISDLYSKKGKFDVAHRASLKQLNKLGINYPLESLGFDTRNVNQELVKPFEKALDSIYAKQNKIANKYKGKIIPKAEQLKISSFNNDITDLVEKSDRNLNGVLMDEKTGKFSNIYGQDSVKSPGAGIIEKSVKEVTDVDLDSVGRNVKEQKKFATRSEKNLVNKLKSLYESEPEDSPVRKALDNKSNLKSTLLKLNKPDLKKACRALGAFNVGGDVAGCAAAVEADPVKAATALEEIKPTSAALGKVRNAATSFLKFAGKGKVFGVTAGLGVGAGALVKKFMNDDPSTYLTNDKQANAMILDTIDEKERQERMEAIGDAPELLDEARIAGEVGVTAAAIPGSGAVYGARKKPFTRIVDGVKKTRPAMGTARAALGPVGKALSGFATPAGIAALTPLNVASSLYEGDSGYEIATDPLNYLAPAFAGTMGSLSKEATRGMGATSKLAKVLRLGMSPGAIKMVSRRFGLPGLALSSGISLYELADEYKSGRGMFGKKE